VGDGLDPKCNIKVEIKKHISYEKDILKLMIELCLRKHIAMAC
jgi:hypothetical protein